MIEEKICIKKGITLRLSFEKKNFNTHKYIYLSIIISSFHDILEMFPYE